MYLTLALTLPATAEEKWLRVSYQNTLTATFYLRLDSVEQTSKGEFFAVSLTSFDEALYDEGMRSNFKSVVEINVYDCNRALVFSVGSQFYTTDMPSQTGFIKKIDYDEIIGHPPNHAFIEFNHPIYEYICSNYN